MRARRCFRSRHQLSLRGQGAGKGVVPARRGAPSHRAVANKLRRVPPQRLGWSASSAWADLHLAFRCERLELGRMLPEGGATHTVCRRTPPRPSTGPTTTALDVAVRNKQRWRDNAAWGGRDNPVQQLVGRALSPMQQLAGRALRLRCQLFDAMLGSLAWARVVFLIALRRTARAAAGSWWQLRGRLQLSF